MMLNFDIISVCAIIGFNLVLYFPTIFFDIVMDDTNWYEKIGKEKFAIYKNPLLTIRDRLYGAATFGLNKRVDHCFTLSLWILLCVLSYYAFGHNNIALGASLLVSCHPLNNEASIWLNGRRYLLCAILLMAFMIAGPVWGLPFYFASGLFQVTIFFAPVIFALKAPWMILAIGALFLLMKGWVMAKIKDRAASIYDKNLREWQPKRPVVIVKIFGFYFWKMVWPARVQMVYQFLLMFGRTKEGNDNAYSFNRDFFNGVAAIVLCGVMFFMLPYQLRPWAFFMALSLLQWCAIVPVTQLISDRYATIPNIFMSFFLSYFAFTYLPLWAAVGVIGFLAGHYVLATRQVFQMYKDMNSWYEYHVYNGSAVEATSTGLGTGDDSGFGNLSVVNLYIGLLLQNKKLWQAQALIEKALERWPNDYAVNYLGYICAMIMNVPPMAQKYLDVCKKNVYLGEDEQRKGELDDAQLGLQAMQGQLNINNIPPHMKMKRQPMPPQKGQK